jgi:hypothetical protein
VRKDSEPRCDEKLVEDCRRTMRERANNRGRDAIGLLEWVQHREAIGYCILQTKRETVTAAVQAEVLDQTRPKG